MSVVNKRPALTFTIIAVSVSFIIVFSLYHPRIAASVTSADICPKHNVSSGEYTACFYCHNAEAPEEPGFTIHTDSSFCLSCHDGSSLDVSAYTSPGSISERMITPSAIGHIKGVDHPFSVSYTEAKNLSSTLKLKGTPASPVKLFNDKIECASCHDPHSCKNPLFLRISNDRSKLCLACHDM